MPLVDPLARLQKMNQTIVQYVELQKAHSEAMYDLRAEVWHAMTEAGMTQADIAEASSVDPSDVSRALSERGLSND